MKARKVLAVAAFCIMFPVAMVGTAIFCALAALIITIYAFVQIVAGFIAGAWVEAFGWELHHSNGAWAYYINPRTGMRKAVYVAGHSPLEYRFLRPGDTVIDEVGSHIVQ